LLGLYAAWRAHVPLRAGFEHGDVYFDSWKFRAANFAGQFLADRIMVCSQDLADWVHQTHAVSCKKLAVLHNCIDVRRFHPRRNEDLRRSWRFPGDPTVFAAVGSLGNGVNKRVDVCIRAVGDTRRRGADVVLVICGDGEQRSQLEGLVRGWGLETAVRFLGMRLDIPDVLAACDVFCHAAPREPFGIVCVEAMAMGLPVIVPNAGGIREAVEDGVWGLLYAALDHEGLATAMCRLHAGPEMRKTMGHHGRRVAESRFSIHGYLQRLYGIYGLAMEQILGEAEA